jgi:hypothetical protein
MERRHDPVEFLGAGLKMTRRWQIEYKRKEWLKDSRHRTKKCQPYKALPQAARAQIVGSLRPTTLLDLVYELRRRSNYESADEYGSDAEDLVVARFHGGMLYLLESGLLFYESELARYIGIDAFLETSSQWRQSQGGVNDWVLSAFDRRIAAISTAAGR